MKSKNSRSATTGEVYCWVTAAFGLFFVGIAIVIVYFSGSSNQIGAYVAALLTGGLGVDAIVSAARNRQSILSRIGPLP